MATETETVLHYGVARGEKLIGEGTSSLAAAQQALFVAQQQMVAVGLEPDVRLVEYDVETTIKAGRVRAYQEPVEEPAEAEPATDATSA